MEPSVSYFGLPPGYDRAEFWNVHHLRHFLIHSGSTFQLTVSRVAEKEPLSGALRNPRKKEKPGPIWLGLVRSSTRDYAALRTSTQWECRPQGSLKVLSVLTSRRSEVRALSRPPGTTFDRAKLALSGLSVLHPVSREPEHRQQHQEAQRDHSSPPQRRNAARVSLFGRYTK